jgi:hypothetical protein
MPPIRITKHLDSETLYLPELRPLIGHDVEIVVSDEVARASDEFWNPPTLDELARRQGVKPFSSTKQLSCPELKDAFEGFDEYLEARRKEQLDLQAKRDLEVEQDK